MASVTIKSKKFQKLLRNECSCIKRPYAKVLRAISKTKKLSVTFKIISLAS